MTRLKIIKYFHHSNQFKSIFTKMHHMNRFDLPFLRLLSVIILTSSSPALDSYWIPVQKFSIRLCLVLPRVIALPWIVLTLATTGLLGISIYALQLCNGARRTICALKIGGVAGLKPRGGPPSMSFFSLLLGRVTLSVFMDG